jgi:hypothetical protein
MQKLIATFKANTNEITRAKLQAYIRKHPMAICMLTAEEFQFLKTNGFSL